MERSESRNEDFEVLFNNSTSGIAYHEVVYDSNNNPIDYILTNVNPQFEKILALKRKDVINKKATDVYNIDKAPYLDIYSEVAKSQKPTSFETYFPPIDIHFKISVLSQRKGTFITIFDDISGRKNANEALKNSEIKYREAYDRASFYKDLFAHDINNILQVINSSTELLSHRLEGFEKYKDIKLIPLIMTQITRAKRLVNLVNLLSELEEKNHPIKSTEICELLRNSIIFMHNSFPENKINLQITSFKKNIIVQANELLQQVFENILINAIKYNDKETIELEIRLSILRKKKKRYIQIEFIDNGMGIVDNRKAFILEKGYKELKSGQGMGIGLALVKKIIESYKGEILIKDRVIGEYTQGTNFILLLPL